MAHPCSSAKPPAWCNRKKKRSKSRKACSCPSGWTSVGIMCKKGRQMTRSSCAGSGRRKRRR